MVAALFAAMLEGQTHGVGMRHIALHRLEDGGLQIGGAVAVQQSDQGGSDGAQIGAPFRGAREQSLAGGDGVGEAVGGAVLASGAFLLDQGRCHVRAFYLSTPLRAQRSQGVKSIS